MEREFEDALQKFLDDYLALCEKLHTNQQEKMLLDENSPYNVLKQALTELQAIKEAKPSEAMECLATMYKLCTPQRTYHKLDVCNNTIKQALLKAQELEKENTEYKEVLTLIKNKMVDLDVIASSDGYIMYNAKMGDKHPNTPFKDFALTEDEFNKVKRYSGNE